MKKYILALDSGTVKNRAVLFDRAGRLAGYAERPLTVLRRQPGWVEQDAEEIYDIQRLVAAEALRRSGIDAADIEAIGITNQRETTVIWDRHTGEPIAPALCWQSQQSLPELQALKASEGIAEEFRQKTSMVFTPYFSISKIIWLMKHVPGAREKAEAGDLLFGTVDSWLLYKLSGGKIHATDCSNASRTMLFHLKDLRWDSTLLAHAGIDGSLMPVVNPTSAFYGTTAKEVLGAEIPITALAGNQQADLFGQRCFAAGMAKNTYGKGSFFLLNTGDKLLPSQNGLNTTIAWTFGDTATYALEGSVMVAGFALDWLRDGLGLIASPEEANALAASVADSGVYFVPAFRGVSAPYWEANARGMIVGLLETTTQADIARAALASMAYRIRDIVEAVGADIPMPLTELHADGGGARSDLLMQLQADILGLPVQRQETEELTARGVAFLAGLATGFWKSLEELQSLPQEIRLFTPKIGEAEREQLYDGWQSAMMQALGWSAR